LAVTGNVTATSFTGSLLGTASFATTASFALNAGGGGGTAFPFTGSAAITGSLGVTGSISLTQGSLNVSGSQYGYAVTSSTAAGTNVIASVSTGSFRAAFFNYVAFSGSNARAGQIASVWYLATMSFAETMTTDIGTTVGINEMSARISGSFVQLVASASAGWGIETSVNLI
jgi:hypothetical protein